MPNLRASTLGRAAAILGGVDVLAIQLALSPETVARYLRGDLPVPPNVFLRASEIVTDATVVDAAKVVVQPDPNRLDG
jgi:hypothetical protein